MTPEFAAFKKRFDDGNRAGVLAAALHYQGAVRAKLQRGYTSGAFVTGATAASVQVGESRDGPNGPEIFVGSNELVAMYWELGHFNTFTRRYERVEYFRETLDSEAATMASIMGSTVAAALSGASAGSSAAVRASTIAAAAVGASIAVAGVAAYAASSHSGRGGHSSKGSAP